MFKSRLKNHSATAPGGRLLDPAKGLFQVLAHPSKMPLSFIAVFFLNFEHPILVVLYHECYNNGRAILYGLHIKQ